MPAGGESIIVGQYTVTWNSVAMGIMVGEEGLPTIYQFQRSKPINKTDKYGATKIDSVYLGKDYVAEYLCQEYKTGTIAAYDPYGSSFGLLGTIGRLKYNLAQALVLTVVAGTPAAGSPNTLTANKAILADDHQGKLVYGPEVRTVPIKQDLLLYDTGSGVYGAFTQT